MNSPQKSLLDSPQILDHWQKELKNNPHYAEDSLQRNEHIEPLSKNFLSKLVQLLKNDSLKQIKKEELEPILSVWHQLLKEKAEHGLTVKDTALLLYALKTSLIHHETASLTDSEKEELLQLENILDILGILIFELYSSEKEHLISKQNEHILYLQSKGEPFKVIGNSPAMHSVFKAMSLVIENDVTVLIQGESGTGKDVIASAIHQSSKRAKYPFIAINCGAIPKELIESELFGHEKGAFTGADERKAGKFELADGGTLFLDEIGEMPLELQVKLLRVLQNQEVEPIGRGKTVKIDVRIIAATNQPLKTLVDEKKFRLDLYYRLNVFPIHVPPLRERPEDILPLAEHFIEKISQKMKLPSSNLTKEGAEFLMHQKWEGNARELENTIHRALILAKGNPLTSTLLSYQPGQSDLALLPLTKKESKTPYPIVPLEELEKEAIENALTIKKGNLLQAAKALGVSRTTLYNKIERYQINTD